MVLGQLLSGVTIGAVYSLIAIGFSMVYRSIGLLNFSHPQFIMVGALIGYSLATGLGLPFVPTLIVCSFGSGLVAMAVEIVGLSTIRARRGPLVNQIIATVGWATILTNSAQLLWGPYPLSYPPTDLARTFQVGGIAISYLYAVVLVTGIALMAALQVFYRGSRMGIAMRATADDPEVAMLMGIDPSTTIRATFFLSGVLAGVAGMFVAELFYASFDIGAFGLRAFSAAVLGGFGNIGGAMLGGLVLGIVETFGATYISSAYKDAIAFVIVIVMLLVRPTGLLASARRVA